MCGIAGILGERVDVQRVDAMVAVQRHRGPDEEGTYADPTGRAALGHCRLRVLDLTKAGRQPMVSADGRHRIVFNGEVYNHVELRRQLEPYPFRSRTDTEVVLAAYARWGEACLDRLLGMFAFALWDEQEQRLVAARDRFGVKPLYFAHAADGSLTFASEVKALHAAGIEATPDESTWATYLTHGLLDHGASTFWEGVRALAPGHVLTWHDGTLRTRAWYDLAEAVGTGSDPRPEHEVMDEYLALLEESVRLRFRSDVAVGVNLSGGLDSSLLLGLVQRVQGAESDVKAFTFVTGDERYDETPWVHAMLERTRHPSILCPLSPDDVPALAASVAATQDEPGGGLPTLAYARLFERAAEEGVTVLLDGQGMDEQWAGYDYYQRAGTTSDVVQGTHGRPVRPECLQPEFRALAVPLEPSRPTGSALLDLQLRDLRRTKIPRALRYNDRVSMRSSRELREPFLDHRLVECALRQPAERKVAGGRSKVLLRRLADRFLPDALHHAPKRPVQTPQREWLRGPLRPWVEEQVEEGVLDSSSAWFDTTALRNALDAFLEGEGDNAFFVWQWLETGWAARRHVGTHAGN